jgi:hypothetical protein
VAEKKMRERREFIERYSSLEDRVVLDQDLDFRRKRGMLEEVNKAVRDMEDEERELRQIRERDGAEDSTPIEPTLTAGAPAPVPETEEKSPPAPVDDMKEEEAPAEERLAPASHPAPALRKAAGKRKGPRKPAPAAASQTPPAVPAAAPAPAARPTPPAPAAHPAPSDGTSSKPAPAPAKE